MKILYSQTVNIPTSKLFASMTDFEKLDTLVSAVIASKVTTPGPTKEGTIYQETRKMFGKEHTEEMRVMEFIRDKKVTLLAEPGNTTYKTTYWFHPQGESTKVDIEFLASTTSLITKLMMPLMSVMMKKTMIKCFKDDLTEIEAKLTSNN